MIKTRKLQMFIVLLSVIFMVFGVFVTASAHLQEDFWVQTFLNKDQALKSAFPEADEIKKEKIWTTPEQRQAIGKICLQTIDTRRFNFYAGKKNDQTLGYALIDRLAGKDYSITLITLLNIDGSVRDVEVMVYRGHKGSEIKHHSFLSQFFGNDSQSNYREIKTIAGAITSSQAIAAGVHKATAAYKIIYLKN